MAETDGQMCPLQHIHVSRGRCNACNRYYRTYGVHPFLLCFNGHTFRPEEAITDAHRVFCPTCKEQVQPQAPTGGQFCCDHIQCKETCDWYGNPDRCNLARDPKDARLWYPKKYEVMEPEKVDALGTLLNPDSYLQQLRTVNIDGYLMAMHQISNQEMLRVSEPGLKKAGKEISEEWLKTKFLHQGNADVICGDIQDAYNRVLNGCYSRVKVVVLFEFEQGKPKIKITAGNTMTAWLLHELVPYVSFF